MSSSSANKNVNIAYCAFAMQFMNVRINQPIEAMRQHGANIAVHDKKVQFLSDSPAGEPKILILQRAFLTKEAWPNVIKEAIKRDYVVVNEYDDYPENPHNAAKRAKSLDWERFKMCHAVQCSTQGLADAFSDWNSEVKLFENQFFKTLHPINRSDKEVRVFFGALNRKNAWEPLIDRFNKVLKKYQQLRPIVLHDKEFFDALASENKVFKPTAQYDDYLNFLHCCDISIQPLDDSKFNRYKSDIKFLEAGAGGLAVIASPTVYENSIRHGENGLIARTPDDWENMLAKLACDHDYRKQLGQNAKNYVLSERMLVQHIHKQLDWYRDLWARRDELNARLFDLYPELKP